MGTQCKRLLLALASCVFGLTLLLPASSWAVTYTYDLGAGWSPGLLNFDGNIGSLTFSPQQSLSRFQLGVQFPFMAPHATLSDELFETAAVPRTEADGLNCGDFINCSLTQQYRFELIKGGGARPQILTITWLGSYDGGICPLPDNKCRRNFRAPGFPSVPLDRDELNQVPEPSTVALFATGLLGLAGYRWQQQRREGAQLG